MGHFLSTLLLLVLTVSPAIGESAARYNEANRNYKNGRFDEAIVGYEAVLQQGTEHGYVYYNLGNAYYKLGQIGRAILAYERALRLIPGDEDVVGNLRYVNALRKDRETDEEESMLTRVLKEVYGAFSVDGLTFGFSLCLFLVAGAGVGWLFLPHRRVFWVVLMASLTIGAIGTGALTASKIYDREGVSSAIILADQVLGRSGPDEEFLQVFTLHEGTKVRVERAEGAWVLIRLANGIGGWLPVSSMERI